MFKGLTTLTTSTLGYHLNLGENAIFCKGLQMVTPKGRLRGNTYVCRLKRVFWQ